MNNAPVITVCMGSSCFSRGNEKNLALIEQFITDHALDSNVELAGSLCEDYCTRGPIVKINDKICKIRSERELIQFLETELIRNGNL